jgi:predicted esterase
MPVIMYIDPAAKSKPSPGGPLILYYHATGSQPGEVMQGFGQANITKVTSMGGVVAAFTTTACPGCTTTDDNVWFQEDGPIQDTVVACAMKQANIDTTHIHALGWSAGALHSMWVAFARANYMASVISYSGGGGTTSEDPTNKVPAILTYGDMGSDQVIIDFNQSSHTYFSKYQPMGYYTMMCHHPGGHEVDPMVAPHSLEFFMAEPYKVSPQPYATKIPADFPSYCGNVAD